MTNNETRQNKCSNGHPTTAAEKQESFYDDVNEGIISSFKIQIVGAYSKYWT